MLRGLSKRSAPLALAGVMWPPFCGTPPWEVGGGSGAAGESTAGLAGGGAGNGDAAGGTESGGDDSGGEAPNIGGAPASAGSAGSAAGSAGTLATGGSGGEATPGIHEPVLGCAPGVWPETAVLQLLPPPALSGKLGEAVNDLSADGEVLVGSYYTRQTAVEDRVFHPVAWSASTGWYPIGDLSTGRATLANCNGSVVAGVINSRMAFIAAGGRITTFIGEGGSFGPVPRAISADGSVLAGNMESPDSAAPLVWKHGVMRWVETPSVRSVLHLSFDGSSIAGRTDTCLAGDPCDAPASLFVAPFPEPGYAETLYGGQPSRIMSADGSTFADDVYGAAYGVAGHVMRLFRPATGELTIIPCPDLLPCHPAALSSRGAIVLGTTMFTEYTGLPFVWTAQHGARPLWELGAAYHPTWEPVDVRGIDMSDDGRVIVGSWETLLQSGNYVVSVFRLVLPHRVYE